MAAKAAFSLADLIVWVSGDCVVETVDIELAAHHAVIELVSKSESGTGIFNAKTRRKKSDYVPQVREQRPRKLWRAKAAIYCASLTGALSYVWR